MKFNVAVCSDSTHTQAFSEVALSVAWALQQLGHEVTESRSSGQLPTDARSILFGVRPGSIVHVPDDTIIYNGEQVNKDGMWPSLVDIYKRYTVWDYSVANSARYVEHGLPIPRVVQPGYCPLLAAGGRFQGSKKTHDVVFFGSQNERRERVLQAIEAQGFSVLRVPFGVYGAERDALIDQARLCVNIHYYESAIFEAVRCAYLAQRGVPVISESSVAGENNQWGISGISYNSLAAFVCNALGGDLEAYGKSLADAARKVSVLDDVRAALSTMAPTTELWSQELDEGGNPALPTRAKRTQQKFTLCMIVKDEKDVIERCLTSVKPFISRWCIVDTGSTDGTQDIIRKFMSDTPGQLHECSWKEFDGSRSEAINLARQECQEDGWLLLIDADEQLQVEGDLQLAENYDCYNAWITRCEGCTRWVRPMFLRANKPWFYEMPRHEGLYSRTPAPTSPHAPKNVLVMSSFEGARAKVGAAERFLKDAQVLEAWLPQHPGHARCQYYIAQSYHCAATATVPPDKVLLQKAVVNFLKRAEMLGYAQESFTARYLAAQCMMQLEWPWERILNTYLQAYVMRPSRAEPLYNIARYYRVQGDNARAAGKPSAGYYAACEIFARRAVQIGPSEDTFPEVDHSVNDWRAKDELATALTFLNGHAEARDLFRHILRVPEIGPIDRERIEINLEMCKRVAPDPA